MKSLLQQFNKRAITHAVLLCILFCNLSELMAQMGKWEIPFDKNFKVIIIPENNISGSCADPVGYTREYKIGDPFFKDYAVTKPSIDSAFLKTPPSKYYKVKAYEFFSIKVLSPQTFGGDQFTLQGGNGKGEPPFTLVWDNVFEVSFEYKIGTQVIDGVTYDVNRAKGRIVGGSKKAWFYMLAGGYRSGSWKINQIITLPIVSEGQLNQDPVPVLGTTVQPQIPYLVLHAPPGDGSSSEFQETKTFCREFSETNSTESSNSANLDVKLGIAGSLGFIATVDFEFSVTFSAGISGGELAIKSKSNQTCATVGKGFSTGELLAGKGSGDVFIGYGTDLNYGVYQGIKIDPKTCTALQDTALIYSPTGNPRKFVYTEEAIQTDIIIQKSIAANQSLNVRTRNQAQNQADVWEKVLAMNNANKNNPNNPLIESISISGKATTNQESSISVVETNSLEVEHFVEFTTGLTAVVEIGGSGVTGGYEYRGKYSYGKTNSSTDEKAKMVRYTMTDDDRGDLFNVKVVRDPMFGTPVFRIESGTKSSCPYQGGYQLDQPKLRHDGTSNDHIISQGNKVGSSATFKIDLCNESNEARTYNLKLNAQSNLNGAVVSAAGVPLNGNDLGQSFNVPANSCVQDLIVEVKQLSANSPLSYPNLELFLYSECEPDIQSSVFASVYFGNASGTNNFSENKLLSVFPNPASDMITIELLDDIKIHQLQLVDSYGKVIDSIVPDQKLQQYQMDISGLKAGLYFVQLRSDFLLISQKVFVNP